MTALLYLLEPERVCLAMDTCSLDLDEDGRRTPGVFCSKMLILPHLKTVVCGTGIRTLMYYWSAFLQQNVVARDVSELDNIAIAKLPEFFKECDADHQLSSTIYHFGYSLSQNRMAGFAYRSSSGFESEQLIDSLGVKPQEGVDSSDAMQVVIDRGLPDGFVDLMEKQKAHDDAKPQDERVGIGGEVQFLLMEPEQLILKTCHRFKDYEEHFSSVRSRTTTP